MTRLNHTNSTKRLVFRCFSRPLWPFCSPDHWILPLDPPIFDPQVITFFDPLKHTFHVYWVIPWNGWFLALFIGETGQFDPLPPNPSTSFGGSKKWCLFMRRFLRKQLVDSPLYVQKVGACLCGVFFDLQVITFLSPYKLLWLGFSSVYWVIPWNGWFLALFIGETGQFDPLPPNPSTSFGGSKKWCLFMRRFLRKQLVDSPLYVQKVGACLCGVFFDLQVITFLSPYKLLWLGFSSVYWVIPWNGWFLAQGIG